MESGAPITEGEGFLLDASQDAYERGDQPRALEYGRLWERIYRRVPPSAEVVQHVIALHDRPREGRSTRRRAARRQRRASRDGPDDPEPPGGRHPDDLDGGSAS
ncbi:MAG TPA: hypothetical protein VFX13_11090 [Gaiellales bacterium]|nr:hypothetical protein [Gaiellales bacterium]